MSEQATPREAKSSHVAPTATFSLQDPFVARWLARNWSDRCKAEFFAALLELNEQGQLEVGTEKLQFAVSIRQTLPEQAAKGMVGDPDIGESGEGKG